MKKTTLLLALFALATLAFGQAATQQAAPPTGGTNQIADLPDRPPSDQGPSVGTGSNTVPAIVPPAQSTTVTTPPVNQTTVVTGDPGPRGEQGPRGPAGRNGKIVNITHTTKTIVKNDEHNGVYEEIKKWNPASMSYVDAKINQVKSDPTELSSDTTTSAGGSNQPEEKKMNQETNWALVWLIGFLIAIPLGTAVWWWGWGVHKRDHIDPNRKVTDLRELGNLGSFRMTTANTSVEFTPTEVATVQASSKAWTASARADEATALAAAQQNRQQALAGLVGNSPSIVVVNPLHPGPGFSRGGSDPEEKGDKKTYSVDELKNLGVIKPNPEQKKPETKPADANQAKGGGSGKAA